MENKHFISWLKLQTERSYQESWRGAAEDLDVNATRVKNNDAGLAQLMFDTATNIRKLMDYFNAKTLDATIDKLDARDSEIDILTSELFKKAGLKK